MAYSRPSSYPYPRNLVDNRGELSSRGVKDYLEQLYKSMLENDSRGEYAKDKDTDIDLKELMVRPEWYGAKGDGTTDDTAAIQAAGNAIPSAGGTLLLCPGKTYKINSALTFTSKNHFGISGYGATIDASGMPVDSVIMTITGAATATATGLNAAGAVNSTALTVTSSSGFVAGDLISIDSTEDLSEVDANYTKGELSFVESVSAGTINISQGLKDTYSITGETVTITRITQIKQPVVEGVTIIGGGATKKQHALDIWYAESPVFRDVRIIDVEDTGISFNYCESGLIDNCYGRNIPGTVNGVGYGFSMGNHTQNSIVIGCRTEEVSAGASVDTYKACWNNRFINNTFINSPTARCLQCHNSGIGTSFVGNTISGGTAGISIMAPRCIVANNSISNISYTGINIIYDGMRDVQICGNKIISLRGMDIHRNNGTSPSLVSITNNHIVGTDLAGGDGDLGIWAMCAGATIRGNKIRNVATGIEVGNDDIQITDDNEISDITASGNGITIVPNATYGGATSNRTRVCRNHFYSTFNPTTMAYGVYVTPGVAGTIIENNHIKDYLTAPYNDDSGITHIGNWYEDPMLGMVQEAAEWTTNWGVSVMAAVAEEITETRMPYRPTPVEKLTDGGLEAWLSSTNLTNWTEVIAGTTTINQEDTDIHGDTYSCRVDVDASNSAGYIHQTDTLGSSAQVKVSLWYKTSAGKTAYIQVQDSAANVQLKSDGSWAGAWAAIVLPVATIWTKYELSFVTHDSYSDYTLLLRNYDAASSSIYWDDVSLTTFTTFADSPISSDGTKVNVANLVAYANDVAAGAGGLVAGDLYVETGTNPLRLAVKS